MEKYTYIDEWNRTHLKHNKGKIISDNWLDKYEKYLKPTSGYFLDLGCGSGNDTKVLQEKYTKKVIAADFSEVAIKLLKNKIRDVQTALFDMTNAFPFDNNFFSFIISDLSLQYFDYADTSKIISEIRRVIKKDGYVLLRLSAIDDYNYGAMNGEQIDYHFYHVEKRNKRYFDETDIRNFFSDWIIYSIKKCTMGTGRYEYSRSVYEVLLKVNDSYKGTKTLYNGNILLRHLRMNDAQQMFEGWTSNFEVAKYVTWEKHSSIEETKDILHKWIDSYKKDKKIWGIELDKKLVGTISIVSENENECEVGYVIAKNQWNKGIATCALQTVIGYLKSIGYQKIIAEYFSDNIASGRVMEKAGMKRCSDIRKQFNNKTRREESVIRYEIKF